MIQQDGGGALIFTVSGAEIVGFIIFAFLVGPTIFVVGRLWQRITEIEAGQKKQWGKIDWLVERVARLLGRREGEGDPP